MKIGNNASKYSAYIGSRAFEHRFADIDEIKSFLSPFDLTKPTPRGEDGYSKGGMPFISDTKTAYLENGDEHTLILGATGSKKTRLFVFPTVYTLGLAGEDMVISDPKGEIYNRTSQWLKDQGYNVRVINLRDPQHSDTWNPLYEAYLNYKEGNFGYARELIADYCNILKNLSEKGEKPQDAYWPEAAADFLEAVVLLLMETQSDYHYVNMKGVSEFAAMCDFGGSGSASLARDIVESLNPLCSAYLKLFPVVTMPSGTMKGILGHVHIMTSLFANNNDIARLLSDNNIDLHVFGSENKKNAIFIIVPDEKTSYHIVASLFVKQLYEVMIRKAASYKDVRLPNRVNFLLDEFSNMPKIDDMPQMISAARSRNMRFYLIVQSNSQLKKNYGESAETIKSNCLNWVYLCTKETSLAHDVQEVVGRRNAFVETTGNSQESYLMSISELTSLDKSKGEALILLSRQKPYVTNMPDIDDYKQFLVGRMPLPESPHEDYIVDLRKLSRKLSRDEFGQSLFAFEFEKQDCIKKPSVNSKSQEEIESGNTSKPAHLSDYQQGVSSSSSKGRAELPDSESQNPESQGSQRSGQGSDMDKLMPDSPTASSSEEIDSKDILNMSEDDFLNYTGDNPTILLIKKTLKSKKKK